MVLETTDLKCQQSEEMSRHFKNREIKSITYKLIGIKQLMDAIERKKKQKVNKQLIYIFIF